MKKRMIRKFYGRLRRSRKRILDKTLLTPCTRHITSGTKTDVDVLNKILPSKFDRVFPEELLSIQPQTVQYCDPNTKEVNKKGCFLLVNVISYLNMLVFISGLIC